MRLPARATEWSIYYEWGDAAQSGAGMARERAVDPAVAVRRVLKRLGNIGLPLRKIEILWSDHNVAVRSGKNCDCPQCAPVQHPTGCQCLEWCCNTI